MDKNQQVLAIAFKRSKSKLKRISELKIIPGLSVEDIDDLVTRLATAKALEEDGNINDFMDGQQWYVESLIEASSMTGFELLMHEYDNSFAEIASEDEMTALLDDIKAA